MRKFAYILLSLIVFGLLIPSASANAQSALEQACRDDSIDPFIYNSQECQEFRATDALVREKANCNQRRDTGAVWVVFLEDCITFTEFGGIAIQYLLTFSSVLAGAMFVFASYKYLGSRGDPAALADARDMLLNTVIGIILIATAYITVQILDAALGFEGDPINILPFFEVF